MEKIKNFLNKMFPKHDTGTAGFITAVLLAALLCSGIFANDYFVRGYDDPAEVTFNIGAVLVFLGIAGATYVFGKDKNKIGK